jgi:protein-S-isoprenylcysteine O-methyltransferase Ste14
MNAGDTTRSRGLENRIPPPLVFLATAGLMLGAALLLPPSGLRGPLSWGIGTAALVLAALLGPTAIRRFMGVGTTIDPVRIERASVLVTDGVYRWSRNPMYLAMAALLVSLAAFAAQPWLLLGPLGFVLFITRFQIIPEEHALRARFGETYDSYRAAVRRWI